MSVLGIRVLGDPILRQETIVVKTFDDSLRLLIAEMFETMYVAKGIGLAAPQVGRRERVAVVDVDGAKYAVVNPEVLLSEGREKEEEGCLSIPEIYGDVQRATARVVVRAMDGDGQPIEIDGSALLARCLLHEIDHLHGKLFIDYLSVLKRRAALNKWAKEKEHYPGNLRVLTANEVGRHHTRDEEL